MNKYGKMSEVIKGLGIITWSKILYILTTEVALIMFVEILLQLALLLQLLEFDLGIGNLVGGCAT